MPITCPNNEKPRYRWKNNIRLAFCGKKVVEVKKKNGITKKVK